MKLQSSQCNLERGDRPWEWRRRGQGSAGEFLSLIQRWTIAKTQSSTTYSPYSQNSFLIPSHWYASLFFRIFNTFRVEFLIPVANSSPKMQVSCFLIPCHGHYHSSPCYLRVLGMSPMLSDTSIIRRCWHMGNTSNAGPSG